MGSRNRFNVFFLLLLMVAGCKGTESVNSGPKWSFPGHYETGFTQLNAGHVDSALTTWLDAYQSISDTREIDSRIGSSFIEQVADLRLEHLYEVATEMYYWSLDATGNGVYEEILLDEIWKSEPVFDDWLYEELTRAWEEDVHQAAQIVRSHWLSLDPTPSTIVNERLIEHWERIAYSKRHFDKNNNTVFRTDDRALTYIKYGPPAEISTGGFSYREHNFKSAMTIYLGGLGLLGSTGGSTTLGAGEENDMGRLLANTSMSFPNVDYEIWKYPEIATRGKLLKIFGISAHTGSFQEVESISEFIPSKAFSSSYSVTFSRAIEAYGRSTGVTQKVNVSPGFFILMDMNEQLRDVDYYFQNFSSELFSSLTKDSFTPSKSWTNAQDEVNIHEMRRIENSAPDEYSNYLDDIETFDIEARQYGFYDENNQPYLLTIVDSYPQARFFSYLVEANDETKDIDSFELTHGATAVGFGDTQTTPVLHKPVIPFENQGRIYPAQSVFRIPFVENGVQTFTAEFYDKEVEEGEGLLPASLIARGRSQLEQPSMPKIPEDFEVSDLVLGYVIDDQQQQDEIPFLISINDEIPEFSNLFVHTQFLNLQLDEQGKSQVEIEFWVEENNLLDFLVREQINSIQFSFEDVSNHITDTFEIDLATQEPGKYTLNFVVRDLVAEEEITKKVNFEILSID